MEKKETLKQFIGSNFELMKSYKEESILRVDKNIKIELMIIYLLQFKDILKREGVNATIIRLIETQNFSLVEDSILFEDELIPLQTLYDEIMKIKNFKNPNGTRGILSSGAIENLSNSLRGNPLKDIRNLIVQIRLNKSRVANSIMTLLEGDKDYILTSKEAKLLLSIINMYPVVCYDEREDMAKKEQMLVPCEFFSEYLSQLWKALINGTYDAYSNFTKPFITLIDLKNGEENNVIRTTLERLCDLLNNEGILKKLDDVGLKKENNGANT